MLPCKDCQRLEVPFFALETEIQLARVILLVSSGLSALGSGLENT